MKSIDARDDTGNNGWSESECCARLMRSERLGRIGPAGTGSIGSLREPETMRHAQLSLLGLAIVCTVSGLSIGRSFDGQPPVGRGVAGAEVHVRSIAPVQSGPAMEEPRRLPQVAASPLGVPVEIPAPWSQPRAALEHEPPAPDPVPFYGCRATEDEPGRLPMDDTYRYVGENPLRRGTEKPWDVGSPRIAGWPGAESRLSEALGPRTTYFDPVGAPTSPHAGRRVFDVSDAPAGRKMVSPSRPVGRSIRIPRLPSTARGSATW
jgi:hypothetical protein